MWPTWRIGLGRRADTAEDYSGVLIPLSEAHLHSHSARIGRCEFEPASRDGDRDGGEGNGNANDLDDDADAESEGGKDGEQESRGMLEEMEPAEYTIEGLRREVRKGGKGQWTDYECEFFFGEPDELVPRPRTKWVVGIVKSKVINKAIQDIGMGRYNWQLFVLCGFGWFSDK